VWLGYALRMHHDASVLINTPDIELWPAGLLRARSNADSRLLARSRCVLRRKRDGRYLACDRAQGLQALVPRLRQEPGIAAALVALDQRGRERGPCNDDHALLPLDGLLPRLQRVGLDHGYGESSGLALVAEPARLRHAGMDRYRRPLWLTATAARAWLAMQGAASRDGVSLEAISGYRSHAYQLGIFERKLARGQSVAQILAVNAAPGYSEHHSGEAIDIGTRDEPPAEESFERTAAFEWLSRRAADFGWTMSYPRDNPHGIIYEPWHWRWRGSR
jgi:zinc D-Ala-D-Ala carboxypeptidase